MKPADKPIANPMVVLREDFDDMGLLFDSTTARGAGISPVGAAVWKLMNGRRDLARIITAIKSRFVDAPETVDREIARFIDALKMRGWVRDGSNGDGDRACPPSADDSERSGPLTKISAARSPVDPSPTNGHDAAPAISSHPGVKQNQAPEARDPGVISLTLADGSAWSIVSGDPGASCVVSRFAEAMGLAPSSAFPANPPIEARPDAEPFRLLVLSEAGDFKRDEYDAVSVLGRVKKLDAERYPWKFTQLSTALGREIQTHGGVFVHGALAAQPSAFPPHSGNPAGIPTNRCVGPRERGVILAGPHDVGKTTAAARLKRPWRALCDDATLVVRDETGGFWAHPWPTWTRFVADGPGGQWDVRRAVPLSGIFFLAQAPGERVETMGPGEAASLLVDSEREISWLPALLGDGKAIRDFHLNRFNSICTLARSVPAWRLYLGLTGAFWHEIERTLGKKEG